MKKIIMIFISIFCIIYLSFSNIVLAETEKEAVFSYTDFNAEQGEEFTTTIFLAEGSGIAGFDIQLKYADYVKLTAVAYYYGDEEPKEHETFPKDIIVSNNDALASDIIVNIHDDRTINIDYSGTTNQNKQLDLLTLTFLVDENLAPCEYNNELKTIVSYDFLVNDTDYNLAVASTALGEEVDIKYDFPGLKIYNAGDINLDGRISIQDAIYARRYLARMEEPTEFQLQIGDVNGDNKISIKDPINIQKYIARFNIILGDRVNVNFYDDNGNKIISKSVVKGNGLNNIPIVPTYEGYIGGKWSLSAEEYVEPNFEKIEEETIVYAVYDAKVSTYMQYYINYLLNKYNSTYNAGVTLDSTIKYGSSSSNYEADIVWYYYDDDGNKISINQSSDTAYSIDQPGYDTVLNLVADITSWNGENLESEYTLEVPVLLKGVYATPTKSEIVKYLQKLTNGTISADGKTSISGGKIEYDMNLIRKITNEQVNSDTPYEVRLEWFIKQNDEYVSIDKISRTTYEQTVNLMVLITFNGQPLEDAGKVYFDNVVLSAITEEEIKNYIIKQIASYVGTTMTNGDELWNNDTKYGSTIKWVSNKMDVMVIENNIVTISQDAINGISCPIEAQVSYSTENGSNTFVLEYSVEVSTANTQLVAGVNISESLYYALLEELDVKILTTETLKITQFVNLDLSKYSEWFEDGAGVKHPPITDLTGLSYCENLRLLKISNLNIKSGLSEISSLNNLEALIANNCGIKDLAYGGVSVLDNMINLKLLDLSNNKLTSLNNVLSSENVYSKLKEVYLNDNKLSDVTELKQAPLLTLLTLSNNELESDDLSSITESTYLKYLSLNNNKITDISQLKKLTSLTELRLHNNSISDISVIRNMENMVNLYLGDNYITDLDPISDLEYIKKLYINNNKNLEDIIAIYNMTNLEILNMSNCSIETIVAIQDLTNLKELYAENNQINDFSPLTNLTKIERLVLSNNVRSKLAPIWEEYLKGMENLKTLALSGLEVTNLDFLANESTSEDSQDTEITYKPIERLELSNTDMASIYLVDEEEINNIDIIISLKSTLKYLDISNNLIGEGVEKLGYLNKLELLYADNIDIGENISTVMDKSHFLRYLSLENCNISDIESWLYKSKNYVYIDLARNPISAFNLSYIRNYDNLNYLYLDTTNEEANYETIYTSNYDNNALKALSLQGYRMTSIEYLPKMENLEFLNISNTQLIDYKGEINELEIYPYALDRFTNLKYLDVSQKDVNIFTKNNLEMLYNSFSNIYVNLYAEEGTYAVPEGYELDGILNEEKEAAKILSFIDNMPETIRVAKESISDNNPQLITNIGGYDIIWTLLENQNYSIDNGQLEVISYSNIKDETLVLEAKVNSIYNIDNTEQKEFEVKTDIIRFNDSINPNEYLKGTSLGEMYSPGNSFTMDYHIISASTEGFKEKVSPVNYELIYTYTIKNKEGEIVDDEDVLTTKEFVNGECIEYINTIVEDENLLEYQILITIELKCLDTNTIDYTFSENTKIDSNVQKLIFEADGGTVKNSSNLVIKELSQKAGTTLSEFGVEKTGYTFESWYMDKEYTTKCTLTHMPTEDTIIYAKWTPITYTVIYDGNGGTGSIASSNHIYDISQNLSLCTFKRTGYTFLGWSTDKNATTAMYTNGQEVKNLTSEPEGEVELYAIWKANNYTVAYYPNGGIGEMEPSNHIYDISQNLSLCTFKRTGYTFLGWSTDKNATTAMYTNGQEVKNLTSEPEGEVELYAIWRINTYTITYENLANWGDPLWGEASYVYGEKTGGYVAPTLENYTFLGWSYSEPGFKEGDPMPAHDIAAIANWVKTASEIDFSTATGTRDKTITDDDEVYEIIYPELTRETLKANGYSYLYVTMTFDVNEINDGYQDIWIYSHQDRMVTSKEFESNDSGWHRHTWTFTISLNDVQTDGSFYIEYGANGNGRDNWKLGWTHLTIVVCK